jgi:hypothetical protein
MPRLMELLRELVRSFAAAVDALADRLHSDANLKDGLSEA